MNIAKPVGGDRQEAKEVRETAFAVPDLGACPSRHQHPAHRARKERLARHAGAYIAETAYVAAETRIFTSASSLGEQSWIAGHALVRGDVEFGAHCTVNRLCLHLRQGALRRRCAHRQPRLHRRLQPRIRRSRAADPGAGARNARDHHRRRRLDRRQCRDRRWRDDRPRRGDRGGCGGDQGRAGDGDHGGRSGENGAQARSEPPPAAQSRRARWRPRWAGRAGPLRTQWPEVLAAQPDRGWTISRARPTAQLRPSIRHLCDAIEIAAGFDALPDELHAPATVERLQRVQDPQTGLFPDPFQAPSPGRPLREDTRALYNILAVGYALEILGATSPPHPVIPRVELERLPRFAIGSTACRGGAPGLDRGRPCRCHRHGASISTRAISSTRAASARDAVRLAGDRRRTAPRGLWGSCTAEEGLLQPVNGFYRLTRGTYAQFGLPVPCRRKRSTRCSRTIATMVVSPANLYGLQPARHDPPALALPQADRSPPPGGGGRRRGRHPAGIASAGGKARDSRSPKASKPASRARRCGFRSSTSPPTCLASRRPSLRAQGRAPHAAGRPRTLSKERP